MKAFTQSPPGRLLGLLTGVPGILAASFVLATLALLAVDGHPEGLMAAGVGMAIPFVLWGVWRVIRSQVKTAAGSPVRMKPRRLADQEVTARAEVTVLLEATSPLAPATRTIYV